MMCPFLFATSLAHPPTLLLLLLLLLVVLLLLCWGVV
jgi:hypothetical protein